MQKRRVENMEKWLALKATLIERGYRLWQTQYDWDCPEGFIAGFISGGKRVEIVTHSKEVEKDIINSRF